MKRYREEAEASNEEAFRRLREIAGVQAEEEGTLMAILLQGHNVTITIGPSRRPIGQVTVKAPKQE